MNGMLVWQSTLVGLQVLSGGAILGEVFPDNAVGLFILAVASVQAATAFYQRNQAVVNAEGLK